MRNNNWLVILVIAVVVILIIWYLYSAMSQSGTLVPVGSNGSAGQVTNTPTSTSPVLLSVASDEKLGNYLVASNGMTLYVYSKDTRGVSNCTGNCLINWPPYTVIASNSLTRGSGVEGQIGNITRADGTIQVTYNGQPLYFWQGDKVQGDVSGEGVGGLWSVAKP